MTEQDIPGLDEWLQWRSETEQAFLEHVARSVQEWDDAAHADLLFSLQRNEPLFSLQRNEPVTPRSLKREEGATQ